LTNQPVKRSRKLGELATTILKQAKSLPAGGIISPKEFLHLGARTNVDQALSRLAKRGELLRVGRGMYTRPVKSRFGIRPPSSYAVTKAISERTGETIVSSGAIAANALGLSTQMPMRETFLTSGPSRSITLGRRKVELRHAPQWQVKSGIAGAAVRALLSLGEEHSAETLGQLWPKLSRGEQEQLKESRSSSPAWLARVISKQIGQDEIEHAA
jgi:hypothetical protein